MHSRYLLICVLCALTVELATSDSVSSTVTNIIQADNIRWLDDEIAILLGRYNETDLWNKLFYTTDGGLNWVDITNKLATSSDYPPIAPVYVNPYDKSRAFILGLGENDWVTTDKGQTWQVSPSNSIHFGLRWHPTQSDWAISLVPSAGFDSLALHLTKDAGNSWIQVRDKVIDYDWGDAGVGSVPSTRIYYVVYDQSGSIPYNFVLSDDFGATEGVVVAHGAQLLFLEKQLFVMTLLPTVGEATIQVSPDLGHLHKNFYDADFDFGDEVQANSFAILDDTTGAVYVGVNTGDFYDSHYGDIYVSDASGVNYAISLRHVGQWTISNGRRTSVIYDFDIIHGVEGVYMANVLYNWQTPSDNRDYDQLQSYYSMDNGSKWKMLTPPFFDSQGHPIKCSGCNLHLSGYINYIGKNFGPFYSTDNAIGLIIGTGNVGKFLTTDMASVNTYLSRDAGVTWIELRKGSSIYEIGDHGGIIVLAPFGQSTDTVFYTLDFGTTPLKPYKFANSPVNVLNIITEPTSTSRKFILMTDDDQLYGLDFSSVFTRSCNDSDYEKWTAVGRNSTCLMGRQVVYRRRIASSLCYIPEGFNHTLSSTNCACTDDDFECDFGYERDDNGACVLEAGQTAPVYPPEHCPEGDTYYESKGYRLEAGNTCEGRDDLAPEGPKPCPTTLDRIKSNKGWIAAVVIIPLVIVLIIVASFAIRSEKIREKIPFLQKLSSWKVGYFGVKQPELDLMEPDTMDDDDNYPSPPQLEDNFTVEYEEDAHHIDLQTAQPEHNKGSIQSEDDFNPRA